MFGIDEKYHVNKKMGLNHFIPKDLKTSSKKRLKEALKSVILKAQIKGEEIPSRVDENYNCQVIMFFDVELSEIKETKFVGDILQKEIKPLCVFRFYDEKEEVYHLAEKRLHIVEKDQIVVESTVVTAPQSLYFGGELIEDLEKYMDIGSILNKQDKLALYMEMLVKIYILNHQGLQQDQKRFFASKVWYNVDRVIELYHHLKEVEALKAKKVYTDKDKININVDIKEQLDQINNLL